MKKRLKKAVMEDCGLVSGHLITKLYNSSGLIGVSMTSLDGAEKGGDVGTARWMQDENYAKSLGYKIIDPGDESETWQKHRRALIDANASYVFAESDIYKTKITKDTINADRH